MIPKERVIKALNHEETGRPPFKRFLRRNLLTDYAMSSNMNFTTFV